MGFRSVEWEKPSIGVGDFEAVVPSEPRRVVMISELLTEEYFIAPVTN